MDIKVHGRAYVRMSEQDAYSLVVTFALYASCGEAVTQTMEFQVCDSQLFCDFPVVIAVGARLGRFAVAGKYVASAVCHSLESSQNASHLVGHRYASYRIFGLRRAYYQFRVSVAFIGDVDSLNGLVYHDEAFGQVYVVPGKGAQLSDPDSRTETYVYSQILDVAALLRIADEFLLVIPAQHGDLYLGPFGREPYAYVPFMAQGMPGSELKDHLQYYQHVLYGFDAQPGLEFLNDEVLDCLLGDVVHLPECR